MECSPPGSSVQGDSPSKNSEWVAVPSFRGSSQPRDWTQVSYIADRSREALPPNMELFMNLHVIITSSVQFSRSGRLTLWDPMDWSAPGFPSPSPGACSNTCPSSHWCHLILFHPLLPPPFNLSQHQGLFQWVSSKHQVAKVLDQGKIVQDSQKDLAMYNKTTYILSLKSIFCYNHKFISVQSLTQVQLFAIPWTAAVQASPSFTISPRLLKLMPMSWCCYPTTSSSVAPFSPCPQSFPAPGSFLISQLFKSGGQSIGASISVLPINIQGCFPLRLTGLIFLLSKGFSRAFFNTTVWKHQ